MSEKYIEEEESASGRMGITNIKLVKMLLIIVYGKYFTLYTCKNDLELEVTRCLAKLIN